MHSIYIQSSLYVSKNRIYGVIWGKDIIFLYIKRNPLNNTLNILETTYKKKIVTCADINSSRKSHEHIFLTIRSNSKKLAEKLYTIWSPKGEENRAVTTINSHITIMFKNTKVQKYPRKKYQEYEMIY